ncbi:hypothetical protein CsSME_00039807 [Camellia sinensis var. sinensis]
MANKYMVHFSGKTIEATVTDKASVVEEWVREARSLHVGQHDMIVGLDCEWKPNTISSMNYRTATLRLCIGTRRRIIQLCYIDYIPQSIKFKSFLSDSNFTFVGVEVGDDVSKLRNEYGLICTSTADIQALAMSRRPLQFYRMPGLKSLAYLLVGLSMENPMHVCRSNWEARVLDEKQIEYACIDTLCHKCSGLLRSFTDTDWLVYHHIIVVGTEVHDL